MSLLENFLHTIVADPSSTAATWLILADWLEEQNDPRSEIVRLLYQPDYEPAPTVEQRHARLRVLLDTVPPLFANGLNAHYQWVPAGPFWMGGGGGRPGKQVVRIEQAFTLGAFPVTQEQWQTVMGHNPSWFARGGRGNDKVKDIPDAELAQFPVESVSWNDVQQFIEKLNEKERASGYLYRLPMAAEWEYACRGGPSSKDECAYHFYCNQPTNDLCSMQANFNGELSAGKAKKGPYLGRPTRVGSYSPNRLGLYDLHGNVWEWCADLYDPNGSLRVYRGGGWNYSAEYCRAASRYGSVPASSGSTLGLRLARVPVR